MTKVLTPQQEQDIARWREWLPKYGEKMARSMQKQALKLRSQYDKLKADEQGK